MKSSYVWRFTTAERIESESVSSLPENIVAKINSSLFNQVLAGVESELEWGGSSGKSAEEFLSDLQGFAASDRIVEVTQAATSPFLDHTQDLFDEILPVIRLFLSETDTTALTSERRATAVRKVADGEDVDPHQVRQRCLEDVIHPEVVDEVSEGQLLENFDSVLEEIEERLSRYELESAQETYLVQIETTHQPDVIYPDLAIESSSIIDGATQLPKSGDRLLYFNNGSCVGKSIIKYSIDYTEPQEISFFWMIVEDYTKFAPIDLDEIEASIGRQLGGEFGLMKMSCAEVEALPSQLISLANIGPSLEAMDNLLEKEPNQQVLHRESLAHLVAGKNILFYGPPGTGKTRAANLLTEFLCTDDTPLVTANAEWSNHKVVGGLKPDDDGWTPAPGFLTEAAIDCQSSLRRETLPNWLIIDELNRANLDEAFGEVFTLLDLDYRDEVPIDYGGSEVKIPLSFRIIGTMNTYDQAQLFSLGYAFRRRFAFVEVDSLLNTADDSSLSDYPCSDELSTDDQIEFVVEIMQEQVPAFFEQRSDSLQADVAPIFPEFAVSGAAQAALGNLLEDEEIASNGLDFTEAMAVFARGTTKRDVIEIGQALLIDATKFVVAHGLLFPEETDWDTVDQAVVAYIIPQFEQFMPALRRAETIEQDSDAVEQLKEVIGLAQELGFQQTASALEEALQTKQVLGT